LFNLFSYQWKGGLVGLAYLAGGLGSVIGAVFCALTLDRALRFMRRHYDGRFRTQTTGDTLYRPEFRLPFLQIGMLIIPAGLLIFGWAAERQPSAWPLPLLGSFIFSFGMLICFVSSQAYLVDVFGNYAASALAAGQILRNVLAFVFCIVGFQLYSKLGYGWGTTVLALVSFAFAPLVILFYRFKEST
jgi:hypothetical protein